jgi:effector-binding domain-containing protein
LRRRSTVRELWVACLAFLRYRIRRRSIRTLAGLTFATAGSPGGENPMTSYAVEFQRLESVPIAAIRRQASASELARLVPECCGLVWNVVRAQQVQAGRHVAIYWDGSIRLEVGVELHTAFADQGGVVRSATPAGAVASATHFGPYGDLGAAHDAVRRWCRANNHRLAGPIWEIYGHWQAEWNADPSRIRTDVYYLLSDGVGR